MNEKNENRIGSGSPLKTLEKTIIEIEYDRDTPIIRCVDRYEGGENNTLVIEGKDFKNYVVGDYLYIRHTPFEPELNIKGSENTIKIKRSTLVTWDSAVQFKSGVEDFEVIELTIPEFLQGIEQFSKHLGQLNNKCQEVINKEKFWKKEGNVIKPTSDAVEIRKIGTKTPKAQLHIKDL